MPLRGKCCGPVSAALELMKISFYIAAVVLSCMAGCGDMYRYLKSGEVGWAMKKELRDKGSKEIVLPSLTRFNWDELYIFGPYEPTEDICKQLALSSVDCKEKITASSIDDGEMVLVFRERKKVVHVELHSRYHGDFTKVRYGVPIPREKAVFRVRPGSLLANGEPQLLLSLKSELTSSNSQFDTDAFGASQPSR